MKTTTSYTCMKAYYPLTPQPVTLELLATQLDAGYLSNTREFTQRAFSAEACVKVLNDLTKIYQKGRKLIEQNAPLTKISAVVGEFVHYEIPKELKDQFSYPCVIQFPIPVKRKPRKDDR